MTNVTMPPIHDRSRYDGLVDPISGMDFYFPGFHAGIGESRLVEHAEGGAALLHASRVWHAVTRAKKHDQLFLRDERQLIGPPDTRQKQLEPVLAEDVFATEQIEQIIESVDDLPPELVLKSDTTAVLGRRILLEMMDRERGRTRYVIHTPTEHKHSVGFA